MKFIGTAAFALAVTSVMGAKLSDSPTISKAQGQCSTGDISCCNPKEELKADGILGNLLAGGILKGLLGTSNSACASTSLIDNLSILSIVKEGDSGTTCKNVIACCPAGQGECVAIDNS
ncbi:hypothetical protein N7475_001576 [Penicillium sp. IBT 31633x]|nr:hypothetical protein N7475_001576 [Penicillium sp. IBT 31633x]